VFARAFAVSWLGYFGFYLCRKNFSVLMPYLKSETGMSSDDLAHALFAYSLLYALGQFVMGRAADKVGARWVVGIGMCVSALMSSLMAWPAFIGMAAVLVVIQGVNGAAQSTGWPGVLKLTRDWFPATNRGVWLGWWSTHLVLGGFAGTFLATRAAAVHWTRGAWVPALVLLGIAAIFFWGARDKPAAPDAAKNAGKLKVTVPLMAIAAMYFCVKLTRYAFLFWLPLYMTEYLHYAKPQAGYASSIYDLVGVLGALGAGYVSERFGGARFSVGAVMMVGLAVLVVTYPAVSSVGLLPNLAWIGLIGAFTFGPDTLMAAAAVHDAVPPESVASAGGFVNGVGSMGQVISPLLVAYLSTHFGWAALFSFLAAVVLCGAAALAAQWMRFPKKLEAVS
jgi:OPA family sugar phosphate sensor protein UhpC-like MFS transporter